MSTVVIKKGAWYGSLMSTTTTVTRASKDLASFVQSNYKTAASAARKVGATPTALNYWCVGARRPGLLQAMKIQRFAGIPLEDWLTDDERWELRAVKP